MKLQRAKSISFFFLLLLLGATNLSAQDCGCDHTITGNNDILNTVNASDFDYQPGDVFCISAGEYSAFRFTGFVGSKESPLIFKNCGGKVVMNSPTYTAIQFLGSRYVHLTGTGSDDFEYGIQIVFSKSGTSGVSVANLSSDFELDHLDISNTGFAGIIAKTDPKCDDPTTWRENFLMENILIHDNFIHETEGEGMYIGGTFGYENSSRECDGIDTFAHLIHHVRIYNNIVENSGWDGFQISLCEEDVKVYDNVIMNYGTRLEGNQNYGLAVGAGTRAEIYNNKITQSEAYTTPLQRGISVIDALTGSVFYNNIIEGSGGDGIWMHIRMSNASIGDLSKGYSFINNTIIKPAGSGIFYNTSIPGGGGPRGDLKNAFHNNLIIDPGNNYENSGFWKTADEAFIDFNEKEQRDAATKSSNLFSRDLNSIGFADPSQDNFSITESSPAVDAGMDVATFGVTFDFNSGARPVGDAYDLGAYEFGASNLVPLVSVGENMTTNLGQEVALIGVASDSDGEVISYLWEVFGAEATAYQLTDATSKEAKVVFNIEGQFTVALTVTDDLGAKSTAELTITVGPVLGLFDKYTESEVQLVQRAYPNPNNGKLYLELFSYDMETVIEFYDLNGHLLLSFDNLDDLRVDDRQYAIDLSNSIVEKGLYLLLVRQGDKVETKRIAVH
jgi:hypothetical protein